MATNTEPKSACCKADYLWLHCDECEESLNDGEGHDFATCTECGADIDD
jgi:hypothetical protein